MSKEFRFDPQRGAVTDGAFYYEQQEVVKLLNFYHEREVQLEDILRMIPECPEHGPLCLSHLKDWIKSHTNKEAEGHAPAGR